MPNFFVAGRDQSSRTLQPAGADKDAQGGNSDTLNFQWSCFSARILFCICKINLCVVKSTQKSNFGENDSNTHFSFTSAEWKSYIEL